MWVKSVETSYGRERLYSHEDPRVVAVRKALQRTMESDRAAFDAAWDEREQRRLGNPESEPSREEVGEFLDDPQPEFLAARDEREQRGLETPTWQPFSPVVVRELLDDYMESLIKNDGEAIPPS